MTAADEAVASDASVREGSDGTTTFHGKTSHHLDRLRELVLHGFEPSLQRSLAVLRLDEFQVLIGHCARSEGALEAEKRVAVEQPSDTPAIGVPLVCSVEAAAQLLGVSRSQMWEMIARDDIESFKIGRLRKIPREAITKYVERQRLAR